MEVYLYMSALFLSSSTLFLNQSVSVFLDLFVSFNQSDRVTFSFPLSFLKQVFTILLHIFLLSSFCFHVVLEFNRELLYTALVHLVKLGKLEDLLQRGLGWFKTSHDSTKDVSCYFNLSIFQFFVCCRHGVILSFILLTRFNLTEDILLFLVCGFSLFRINQLVVNVFEGFESRDSKLLVLNVVSLLLERVV